MKTYVLYHANCNDGFGAAWAAYKWLGDDATYISVNYYEKPLELEKNSIVYLLDFSYKKEDVLKFAQEHAKVIILDHHKSAEEDLKEVLDTRNITGEFDSSRSGAMIAWNFFHPNEEPPKLIKYIQDRDLWTWSLDKTKQVHEVLMTVEYDFDIWTDLAEKLETNPIEIYNIGDSLLKASNKVVDVICKLSHIVETPFGRCAIVNATSHWSEVGMNLLQMYPNAQFSASYYRGKDGTYKWSIRSQGDFDVSAIAKCFGGGGHKNAAGFSTDELIWS